MADPKDHDPEYDPLDFGNEHDASLPSESFEEFTFDEPGEAQPAAADSFDIGASADLSFPSEEMPGELEAAADQSVSIDGMFAEPGDVSFAEAGEGVDEFLPADESPAAPAIAGEGIADDLGDVGEEEVVAAKKGGGWIDYVDWVVALLAAVAIGLLTTLFTKNAILNASFLIMLMLVPFALWKSRRRWTTPAVTAAYTLMLAVGFAGLLCGVYFLGLELSDYGWDLKAKTAKRAGAVYATAAASVPSAPSTAAGAATTTTTVPAPGTPVAPGAPVAPAGVPAKTSAPAVVPAASAAPAVAPAKTAPAK